MYFDNNLIIYKISKNYLNVLNVIYICQYFVSISIIHYISIINQ